jgi:hypothetical protein
MHAISISPDGTTVRLELQVFAADGSYVDPDDWPISNDPAIILASHPSAAKTVTKNDVGDYTVTWSSLTPAIEHGDTVVVRVTADVDADEYQFKFSQQFNQERGTENALTSLGANAPEGWINADAIATNALDDKGNWNVGKTGYTLQAITGLGNQEANIIGNLSGSVGSVIGNVGGNVVGSVASVTNPVAVGTNNDKTGYSLTQAFPTNFAALGISETGEVTTDNASREASKADVSGLLASTAFDERLSETRAGYIDNLDVGGPVATPADVQVTVEPDITVNPTELSEGSVEAIRDGLATTEDLEELTISVDLDPVLEKLDAMHGDDPSGTDTIQDIKSKVDTLDVGAGTGANALTISAIDGYTDPVESLSTRISKGAEVRPSRLTNASGETTYNLDAGTWTLVVSSPLYILVGASGTGVTYDAETGAAQIVIAGTGPQSVTLEIESVVVTPSDPGLVTGVATVRQLGSDNPVAGASIRVQMQRASATGIVWVDVAYNFSSDESGILTITNMVPGASYRIGSGDQSAVITVPVGASGTFEVDSVIYVDA